jgi:SRSO17 transposase
MSNINFIYLKGVAAMLPIVEIPQFVQAYTTHFQDLFSPALFDHFQRYIAGLYISDRRNVEAINKLFVIEVKDQSSLNRFLTEYEWFPQALNQRRLTLLRQDAQTAPKRSGVLILDDTYNEKFGKHFEAIGKYFLPSKKYHALAHNVVTLHYADTVCDYPLEMKLYKQMDVDQALTDLKERGIKINEEVLSRRKTAGQKRAYLGQKIKQVEELRKKYKTKLDLGCELIDWAVEQGYKQTVVMDSWYTCKQVCEHISSKGLEWIGTVDEDEGIYWQGSWHNLGEWVKSRANKEFEQVDIKYGGDKESYYAGSWVCKIGKLGKVRLVASYREADRSDKVKLYVTGKLTWEKKAILGQRRRRWTVETSYEDVKGPLGFDEYEVRDEEGIKRHWYLVFAAYSASKEATAHGRKGNWVKDQLRTVGDVCREVRGEALASLIKYCMNQVTGGVQIEQLLGKVLVHLAR